MDSFRRQRLGEIMGIIRYKNKKHTEGMIYNYSSDEVVEIFQMYFTTSVNKNYNSKNFNLLVVIIAIELVLLCFLITYQLLII